VPILHSKAFEDMENQLDEVNLVQLVSVYTWSTNSKGKVKESTSDYVYSNNTLSILNLSPVEPIFGNHLMVVFEVSSKRLQPTFPHRRDWKS
jgi:hypothetical protein